jgi:hypothetical protein
MHKSCLPAALAATLFASSALAEPTIGLGLSLAFGSSATPEMGVGLRILSDNDKDSDVITGGVDYMIASQSWRGTVGIARLGSEAYVGVDLGFGLQGGGFDMGLSVGAAAN